MSEKSTLEKIEQILFRIALLLLSIAAVIKILIVEIQSIIYLFQKI
jgi:hypothetical protein